jgi:hypothetical protein
MQHHGAVIREQLRAFTEECIVITDADVLEHADRYNSVVARDDIAVILHPEFDRGVEPLLTGPPAGDFELFVRQRYPGDARARDLREVKRKPSPAATDVEDALPGSVQLGRQVTFGELSVIERRGRRFK